VTPDWPPADPDEHETAVAFTVTWAKHLRGFRTLADLQRAAGSKGTISSRNLEGGDPTVTYHWRSEPPDIDGVGYMLATVRQNGNVGVGIMTVDNVSITLSNKGGFICDKCKPPIDIEPPGSLDLTR
jgi:hypothetical protein